MITALTAWIYTQVKVDSRIAEYIFWYSMATTAIIDACGVYLAIQVFF